MALGFQLRAVHLPKMLTSFLYNDAFLICFFNSIASWVPVAHACNPSCSGG
jgi:hypothetical protein